MSNIKILCDTMNDVPENIMKKYDIEVLPTTIIFEGKEYKAGVDIGEDEFYKLLRSSESIPSTSQITYATFKEVFEKYINEGKQVLYLAGSSAASGTYQSAVLASKDVEGDVHIFDSMSICFGCGMLVLTAARMLNEGASLEEVLKENRDKYENMLIITDGVFSMDGDIAKLPEIVELAEKYEAMTYVDDAHGSGVLGESGRGTVDHFNLHGRVDFSMGTLSKAIGVIGGYVAGSQTMYDWLSHRARPILFSTSLPPAAVGAITEALNMLMESTEYTDKLWENARYFKEKIGELGFNTGKSETPITPVIIGDEAKTMEFSKKLLEKGVYVSGIVFPTATF